MTFAWYALTLTLFVQGQVPKFTKGITHPGLSENHKAAAAVDTCKSFTTSAKHKTINLKMPATNVVPAKATAYINYAINVWDLALAANARIVNGKVYGLKFDVINDKPQVLHHLVLFGCSEAEVQNFLKPKEDEEMSCNELKYAWVLGGQPFCTPPNVGIPFDKNRPWHTLQSASNI